MSSPTYFNDGEDTFWVDFRVDTVDVIVVESDDNDDEDGDVTTMAIAPATFVVGSPTSTELVCGPLRELDQVLYDCFGDISSDEGEDEDEEDGVGEPSLDTTSPPATSLSASTIVDRIGAFSRNLRRCRRRSLPPPPPPYRTVATQTDPPSQSEDILLQILAELSALRGGL